MNNTFNEQTNNWFDLLADAKGPEIDAILRIAKMAPTRKNLGRLARHLYAYVPLAGGTSSDNPKVKCLTDILKQTLQIVNKQYRSEFRRRFSRTLYGARNLTDSSATSELFDLVVQAGTL